MPEQPQILLQSLVPSGGAGARPHYVTIAESGETYGEGVAAPMTRIPQPSNVPQLPEGGTYRIIYVPAPPPE